MTAEGAGQEAGSGGGRSAGAGKVPRVDYDKYLRGGAAGRRALVDGLGDALREVGCGRLQGHGQVGDAAAATELGRGLLAALESYFGLPGGALADLPAEGATAVEEAHEGAALLLLVPEVPRGVEVRAGKGEWMAAAANPGELLVVPGAALASLTGGVLPAAEARLPAGTPAWCLRARVDADLTVRPEFAGVR